MRRSTIFLGALFFAVAITLAWVGVSAVKLSQREKPRTIVLTLPARAEVFPEDRVLPGTFKITVPLEKLLQEAAQSSAKTLVTYSIAPGHIHLKYWLPRDGSTMYYAEKWLETKWPWHTSGKGDRGGMLNGDSLVVAPTESSLTDMLFTSAAALVLFIFILLWVLESRSRSS